MKELVNVRRRWVLIHTYHDEKAFGETIAYLISGARLTDLSYLLYCMHSREAKMPAAKVDSEWAQR